MSEVSGNIGVWQANWFSEVNTQWPGQAMSLEIKEILFDKKSEYQHVQVFKSTHWGNVLILDGVIQLTEKDECAYQEPMVHLPLFAHPNPKRVLIIGGGDGGMLREVLRHECVEEVVMCEIDQMVIDVSSQYFPTVSSGFTDKRFKLHCGDGAEFMRREENINYWDIIITDSSDPIGPAQTLFEKEYYQSMHNALRPGGKICSQAECIWIHMPLIKRLIDDNRKIFACVEYAWTQIPTYPCGTIGYLICTKKYDNNNNQILTSKKPIRQITPEIQKQLKFYHKNLHESMFVLPYFAESQLNMN